MKQGGEVTVINERLNVPSPLNSPRKDAEIVTKAAQGNPIKHNAATNNNRRLKPSHLPQNDRRDSIVQVTDMDTNVGDVRDKFNPVESTTATDTRTNTNENKDNVTQANELDDTDDEFHDIDSSSEMIPSESNSVYGDLDEIDKLTDLHSADCSEDEKIDNEDVKVKGGEDTVVCECCNTRDYEIKPLYDKGDTNPASRSITCCQQCRVEPKHSQRHPRDTSGTKTCVRKRQKSESSTSAVIELTKPYYKCSSVWVLDNMAKVLSGLVIVLILITCVMVLVYANPKHEPEYKSNVNVILPHSAGLHVEHSTQSTTTSAQRDLSKIQFTGVPIDVVLAHIANSNSLNEALKVFFDDDTLSEEDIDVIMNMKKYGQTSQNARHGDYRSDSAYHESNDRGHAYNHFKTIQRHPYYECGEPKPVMVKVEESFTDTIKYYLPQCTAVNRCQNTTSCCPHGFQCGPAKHDGIEIVEKYFMVYHKFPGTERLIPANDFIEVHSFISHTKCECQKIEVHSNCDKDCPSQFRKSRPGTDCECMCQHGHRKCNKIRRGCLQLDEEDLICIKEGNCLEPNCQHGIFNVKTGFCPQHQYRRCPRY